MTITVIATVKDKNGINVMILLNHSIQYSNFHVLNPTANYNNYEWTIGMSSAYCIVMIFLFSTI